MHVVGFAIAAMPYTNVKTALFVVGHRTGFRISELLSLKVGDVQQHGKIVDHVTVQRRHMKKKTEGRTVALHPEAIAALSVWLEVLSKRLKGALDPQTPGLL
jgi:integrase